MPTPAEIEAAARVLCRVAFYQLPPKERTCSAELWPDADVARPPPRGASPRGISAGRHSAMKRALRWKRPKPCASKDPKQRDTHPWVFLAFKYVTGGADPQPVFAFVDQLRRALTARRDGRDCR